MRILIITLIVPVQLSILFGSIPREARNNPQRTQQTSIPSVQIEGVGTIRQNHALAFECKITNSGNKSLYIYSALLQNPRFAKVVIDAEQKIIEVRFTRLEVSPLLPYYFPRATFSEVGANDSATFRIALAGSVKDLVGYETNNDSTKEVRITPGRWTLRTMIAYGDDVTAIKRAVASDTEGQQHPINEIVKWQKLAVSNSVVIDIKR